MNALDGCQIAIALPREESSTQARIASLRQAGASVTLCAANRDLWSTLSESAFDAILLLSSRCDAEALAMYDQLRENARARGVPVLLLTHSTSAMAPAAPVLDADVDESAFLLAVADLVTPVRRLRNAELIERALRDQLRSEVLRADRAASEVSDFAHELRAMFGAAMGFACNLRDEVAGPLLSDQKHHVAGILDALQRAMRMLDKKEGTSQPPGPHAQARSLTPASAPPRAQRTTVSMARLVSEVTALFEGVARQKSIRLHGVRDETVSVWGDALKLKQVVANLVVNALKYTQEGGEVRVDVGWSEPRQNGQVQARRTAELTITDNGPGIAAEYRERIFERGFRIDPRSKVAGEGIGLSLVREILSQHGGAVRVDERPAGTGAVFRVSLPQDRRQRARSGALVLHEGDAARALLAHLVRDDNAVAPEDEESFVRLAKACRATILLASDEDVDAALARAHMLQESHAKAGGKE